MKWSVAVLLIGALVFSGAVLAEDKKASKDKLSFELKDTDGKSHKLADHKDKYVVLEWVESRCPAVKPHYKSKNFQTLAAKYKDKGVVWMAVCSDKRGKRNNAETLSAFRKKHGVKHPILLDNSGKVGRMFGAKKTPHMFIVMNGKVLYQGAIDDRKREGGVNYVAQALDELLAGKKVSMPRTRPYG